MTMTRPKLTRRRGACRLCRQKKIRCNGERPCTHCKKQKVECRYSTFSTTSPSFSLRTLAPNVTQTSVITPPDDVPSYNFSTSLDNLSDPGFFLDDTATSVFGDDSSNFAFDIPSLIPPTTDGGGINIATTPSLDSTGFALWGFDPPSSDSASFMTGPTGLEPTARPTPQTWDHNTSTTTPRRDQDHGSGATEVPAPTADRGPERNPDGVRRTNWRIDREEDERAADPSSTYDPLLEDLASAMSRGKKDRHLQEEAAAIMKSLMARSQACCNLMGFKDGGQDELERQDVDFSSLPVHEIINACFDEPGGINIFLDRSDIIPEAERLLDHNKGPLSVEAALVAHVCITRGLTLRSELRMRHSAAVRFFWNTALELKGHVLSRKDSVEKFLALISLLCIAESHGADFIDKLLSNCIAVARSLRLHSTEALEHLCTSHKTRVMVQRACWLLDCIDKGNAMRTRKFELSWNSHIEYLVPPRGSTNNGDVQDLLLLRQRYATQCSRINRRRASAKATPTTPPSDKFDDIVDTLQTLQNEVPHDIQKMDHATISRLDLETKRISIAVCYYIHEALLLLCSQYLYGSSTKDPQQEEDEATSAVYLRAKAICAESIRAVFTVGMHVGLDDYGTEAAFTRVPILALCILVTQLLRDPPPGPSKWGGVYRTCSPLLGMAAGIFGKLGMTAPFEELFQNVADLCLVVGQWNIRGT